LSDESVLTGPAPFAHSYEDTGGIEDLDCENERCEREKNDANKRRMIQSGRAIYYFFELFLRPVIPSFGPFWFDFFPPTVESGTNA
jgi:hypothetical protein